MKYENLEKALNRRYSQTVDGNVTLYWKNGEVVATRQKHVIVLYFNCDSSVICNNTGLVMMAVAKDFTLVDNYRKKVADVIAVNGMEYGYKTIIRRTNRLLQLESVLKTGKRDVLENIPLGAVGTVKTRGSFEMDGFSINLPKEMCEFDTESLNYCILSEKGGRKAKRQQKFISPRDYEVCSLLYAQNTWNKNSDLQERIEETRKSNFHNLGRAKVASSRKAKWVS